MEDKLSMEDKLLETVINGLKYTFTKDVLVKPLPPVKVNKEITEQIPTGDKDENGYQLYDTKTEVKEVDSEWAIGVVLSLPVDILADNIPFKIGDRVVYNKKFAKDFDLFKDSQLVKVYDIIALEK